MTALVRVAAAMAVVWLVLVALAWTFQRQLLYLPDTASPAPPDDVEEVTLPTGDGLELTAWFVAVDDPVTTVLVIPGNAGNRALRLPLARGLVDRGHQVRCSTPAGTAATPADPTRTGCSPTPGPPTTPSSRATTSR